MISQSIDTTTFLYHQSTYEYRADMREFFASSEAQQLVQSYPDTLVVLGGDGTMLRAIHEHIDDTKPFLGINFGTRGHLMHALDDIAHLTKHNYPLLHCRVETGEKTFETFAFNEIVIKSTGGRSIEVGYGVSKSPPTPLLQGGRKESRDDPLPYNPELRDRAREMRKNQTRYEKKIWDEILRKDQLDGYRFLRQKPIDQYIVDFYCSRLLLAIEIDGSTHNDQTKDYDINRERALEELGILTVRFSNEEVDSDIQVVQSKLKKIIQARQKYLSEHPPCKRGAGGDGTSEDSFNLKQKTITGDGLIVATPAGSSGYSLSAGGEKLDLESDQMIITPLAVFDPEDAKHEVHPLDSQIHIHCPNPRGRSVGVFCDGDEIIGQYRDSVSVYVEKSSKNVTLYQ